MKIHEQKHGAVLVLRPDGAIAGADAERFKKRLMEAQRETLGRFVIDASALPMVDSKALEALVEVNEEMVASGKGLKLCATGETVRQVLELTGLGTLFEHFEDVHSAVRSFL